MHPLLASAAAALIAGAALVGPEALAVALVAVGAFAAVQIRNMSSVPALQPATVVTTAAVIFSALRLTDSASTTGAAPLLAVTGVGWTVIAVAQIFRGDHRERLVASLSMGATLLLTGVLPLLWLALSTRADGQASVLLGCVGLAVAGVAALTPGPSWVAPVVAGAAGAAIGAAVAGVVDVPVETSALMAGVVGAVAGGLLGAVRFAATAQAQGSSHAATLVLWAALPLAAAAPAAYLLGVALVGG